MGWTTYQLVQDFFHQQYVTCSDITIFLAFHMMSPCQMCWLNKPESSWICKKCAKNGPFSLDLPFRHPFLACVFSFKFLAPKPSQSHHVFLGFLPGPREISPKLRMVMWKPKKYYAFRWSVIEHPNHDPKIVTIDAYRDIYIYNMYIYIYVLTWYNSFYIYIHRPTWHLHSLTIHA